jgi:hypothetical protein
MSDIRCDVCGDRGSRDQIALHSASGINLCRDKDACRARVQLPPLERAARLCEKYAESAESYAEEWGGSAYWEGNEKARLYRSLAAEIRELDDA